MMMAANSRGHISPNRDGLHFGFTAGGSPSLFLHSRRYEFFGDPKQSVAVAFHHRLRAA
jgi:hypothetical protein